MSLSCLLNVKRNLSFQIPNKVQIRYAALTSFFEQCQIGRISGEQLRKIDPKRQIKIIKQQFTQKRMLTDKLNGKLDLLLSKMNNFVFNNRNSSKEIQAKKWPTQKMLRWTSNALAVLYVVSNIYQMWDQDAISQEEEFPLIIQNREARVGTIKVKGPVKVTGVLRIVDGKMIIS